MAAGAGGAIAWLGSALAGHRNGQYYTSVLDAQNPRWGYDPNIDIVMASVFQNLTWSDAAFLRRCGPAPPRPDTHPAF